MAGAIIEARREALAKCFGHHFVGLIGRYCELDRNGQRTGRLKTFRFSGFVCDFDDRWYFVTAGHVLKQIDDYLQYDDAMIGGCHLIDNFGAKENTDDNAIPFFNALERKYYKFDSTDGQDFGVILLDGNKRRLLTANGISAFTEDKCCRPSDTGFGRYAVLGLPDEMNQEEEIAVYDSIDIPSTFVVTFATDRRIRFDIRNKHTKWHILRLQKQNVFKSIVGMSGGPVFGFRFYDSGEVRYWLVGIQSQWLPGSRYALVCPISKLIAEVKTSIAQCFS